jgi:hypothetical protein
MENPQPTPTVHVLATSDEGTQAALRAAASLAARQQARLVLLVSGATVPDDRFEQMARTVDRPVVIRLCNAPTAADAAIHLTPINAVVFVGGRSATLWPCAEERMAARVRRSGRDVVFVNA